MGGEKKKEKKKKKPTIHLASRVDACNYWENHVLKGICVERSQLIYYMIPGFNRCCSSRMGRVSGVTIRTGENISRIRTAFCKLAGWLQPTKTLGKRNNRKFTTLLPRKRDLLPTFSGVKKARRCNSLQKFPGMQLQKGYLLFGF